MKKLNWIKEESRYLLHKITFVKYSLYALEDTICLTVYKEGDILTGSILRLDKGDYDDIMWTYNNNEITVDEMIESLLSQWQAILKHELEAIDTVDYL